MPQPGGLAGLFQDKADSLLKDAQREAAVAACSTPHVVVKAGVIQDVPGGASSISVAPAGLASSSGGSSRGSSISREDLASALVAAAVQLPGLAQQQGGGGLVFQVQSDGPGQPPASWEQLLEGLLQPAPVR